MIPKYLFFSIYHIGSGKGCKIYGKENGISQITSFMTHKGLLCKLFKNVEIF